MHQSDIPTISKTAPPSYAEAMAQTATKDNSYAVPYSQPMPTTATTTIYDQGCSQMPGYPPSAPANNFYSNIPNQPAYNLSYIPEPSQECHRTTTSAIVHIEPRRQTLYCERCATYNKRIVILIVFAVIIFTILKVTLPHSF